MSNPYATGAAKKFSEIIGWKAAEKPVAPAGFTISKFADSLEHPCWIYVAGNESLQMLQHKMAKTIFDTYLL